MAGENASSGIIPWQDGSSVGKSRVESIEVLWSWKRVVANGAHWQGCPIGTSGLERTVCRSRCCNGEKGRVVGEATLLD